MINETEHVRPAAEQIESDTHSDVQAVGVKSMGEHQLIDELHEAASSVGGSATGEFTPLKVIRGDLTHDQFEKTTKPRGNDSETWNLSLRKFIGEKTRRRKANAA